MKDYSVAVSQILKHLISIFLNTLLGKVWESRLLKTLVLTSRNRDEHCSHFSEVLEPKQFISKIVKINNGNNH